MQFCKTLVHLAQLPCLEAAVACIQSMLKRFWPHPIASFQWGSREKEEIGWVKTLSSGGAVVQPRAPPERKQTMAISLSGSVSVI